MAPTTTQKTGTILACSADQDPECVSTVAIAPPPGAPRHVVMRLGPGDVAYSRMPKLLPGDRIEVSAELEVTTDLPDARVCVGRAYRLDPQIGSRFLLAGNPNATTPGSTTAIPLGPVLDEVCSQERHHHLVVFKPFSFAIERPLPWAGDTYLNLVLGAHHPRAVQGDLLLIGQNDYDKEANRAFVSGDMGKINVVRYRGQPEPSGTLLEETSIRNREVPITKTPITIYSHPLKNLHRGEQLLVKAKLRCSNPHSYPARVSTQVILADTESRADLHGPARDLGAFHGEVCKYNGSNCLPDSSYEARKFGTLRILKPAQQVYINLVVTAGDPNLKANKGDTLKVLSGGSLELRRFPAAVLG